jgi:hypothetical protein
MYTSDEVKKREPALCKALAQPFVHAIAFPTVQYVDVLQIFLHTEDVDPIFACIIMSRSRFREMEAAGWPIEDSSLQVVSDENLTTKGVRTALLAWVERTFPALTAPVIALELVSHSAK